MIIGISGKIGAGKDTLASILDIAICLRLNSLYDTVTKEVRIDHFASTLKKMMALLTVEPVESFHSQEFKKKTMHRMWRRADDSIPTYREAMQFIGTELFRNQFHPNTWVNALMSTYDSAKEILIIPDVRFPNEAAAIMRMNGILIRINRKSDTVSDHESETALDNYKLWHYEIDNNGRIEQLHLHAQSIVNHLNL